MQQLAYEEGARLFQMALDALATAPASEQGAILWADDRTRRSADQSGLRRSIARSLARAASALARKSNDSDALAKAALGIGIQSSTAGTVDRTLVEMLEEALRSSGNSDSAQKAMLLARLAAALYWSDQHDRSVELSQSAVDMARRLDDPRALIYALCMWHYALWGPDNLDARLKTAHEMVSLGERLQGPRMGSQSPRDASGGFTGNRRYHGRRCRSRDLQATV